MCDRLPKLLLMDSKSSVRSVIKGIIESSKQENAFFVLDVSNLVHKVEVWNKSMPRVHPFYAVKCNDHPIVLRTLAALGLGFDLASKQEIDMILDLGVKPHMTIYANTFKIPNHFKYAAEVGLKTVVFDSACELYKGKEIYPDANYVIRIKHDLQVHDIRVVFGEKYGVAPDSEAPQLLSLARCLGLKVVGVSFHIGSGVGLLNAGAYYSAIEDAKRVFDYGASLGYSFNLLDIGGGFESEYDLPKFAEVINSAINTFFPDPNIKIIAEPGRYFVGTALHLSTNIIAMKEVEHLDPVTGLSYPHYMYILNDGFYGSFKENIVTKKVTIPKILSKKRNRSEKFSSSLWGPTCDPRDLILKYVLLPLADYGDWLIFENMGDYTLTMATNFNRLPLPDVYPVIDQITWTLLKDNHLFENIFTTNDMDKAFFEK